jgi:O-acetyl-ADP-ribose deacetylase (regulator of RNase III)
MIQLIKGDLFESTAPVKVNAINAGGVMGRGLALQFKLRYPDYFMDYHAACNRGEVSPGKPHVYQLKNCEKVVGLVTKTNFWEDSTLAEVVTSLLAFRDLIVFSKWKHVAMPALGCGNGKLSWKMVREAIEYHLGDLDCLVEVYEPREDK